MRKEIITTEKAPKPVGPCSQAVRAGSFLFISGLGASDSRTGIINGKTIQEQTKRALQNLQAVLEAGGSSLEKVVSVTFMLADPKDYFAMNDAYAKFFRDQGVYELPARQASSLAVDIPGLKISFAAIALAE